MKTKHMADLRARWVCALFSVLGLAPVANAQTAEATAMYTQSLAATCANCHGTKGRAVEGSSVVTLAGMQKQYIIDQMNAFKSGQRPATIMHQLAKGYSDEQVARIAQYFAEQKK
jgi:cytochrome subunit of sulfide dehydrogenase